MRDTIRELNIRRRTHVSMVDIAQQLNPVLRGWIEYYGWFTPSALVSLYQYVNQTLRAWVRRKFKRYAGVTQANKLLRRVAGTHADIFVHWSKPGGMFV